MGSDCGLAWWWRGCWPSASALGAQSLSYSRGQNVSPAYEGWEEDADGTQLLRLRLHESQLGRRDRRAGRSRQRLQHRRRRSGPADALPAAPQPLHLPRAGAEGLHREGRADLDADDAGQDREGVRQPAARLSDRRRRARVGDRRARRRHQQPGDSRQQAADGRSAGPQGARRAKVGRAGHARRPSSPTTAFRSGAASGLAGAAVANPGSRRDVDVDAARLASAGARQPRDAAARARHRRQERRPARDVVRLPRPGRA